MLLEAVVAAFVATQLCYFAINCGLLGLFVRRPTNRVDERTLGRVLERTGRSAGSTSDRARVRADGGGGGSGVPDPNLEGLDDADAVGYGDEHERQYEHGPGPRCRLPAEQLRRIHVFVPLVDGRTAGLERTLESVAGQSYPAGAITVCPVVVSEPASGSTSSRATAGDADGTPTGDLEAAIDTAADRWPSLEVDPIAVDGKSLAPDRADEWCFRETGVEPATAAALTAAYRSRSIPAIDAVTVLRPGTRVPVDAFELAVAGLTEYDIVQAKRTAADVDSGILPLLESMASAAWSDLAYAASKGPYHLHAEGYVVTAGVVDDLRAWQRERDAAVTFGTAASKRGYTLGVLDRYVRVPCPTRLRAWTRAKRRGARSLYRQLFARGWTGVDDVRGWTGTLLLGALAVVSLVGLPAAAGTALLAGTGVEAASLSAPVLAIAGFNALVWSYALVGAYRAAWDAVPFRSYPHWLAYSLLTNPLAQALYAMLYAVPIALGLVDTVRGDAVDR